MRFSHKEKLIQHETNVTRCALFLNVGAVAADPNGVFIRLYLRKRCDLNQVALKLCVVAVKANVW